MARRDLNSTHSERAVPQADTSAAAVAGERALRAPRPQSWPPPLPAHRVPIAPPPVGPTASPPVRALIPPPVRASVPPPLRALASPVRASVSPSVRPPASPPVRPPASPPVRPPASPPVRESAPPPVLPPITPLVPQRAGAVPPTEPGRREDDSPTVRRRRIAGGGLRHKFLHISRGGRWFFAALVAAIPVGAIAVNALRPTGNARERASVPAYVSQSQGVTRPSSHSPSVGSPVVTAPPVASVGERSTPVPVCELPIVSVWELPVAHAEPASPRSLFRVPVAPLPPRSLLAARAAPPPNATAAHARRSLDDLIRRASRGM
jgi:hypothetical protein